MDIFPDKLFLAFASLVASMRVCFAGRLGQSHVVSTMVVEESSTTVEDSP
jgi:hypothetical protein